MSQMQTQEKFDAKARSIGDICPTRAATTLFFTKSNPTTVVDENQNLICFYAKQVMSDDNSHRRDDTKENKIHNMSTATTSNESGEIKSVFAKRDDYWYFFSPLYHGESPVACITIPRLQEGTSKIIPIYTFKRTYSGQSPANVAGYFGERIYSHGYFAQSEAGFYQLIRYPPTSEKRGSFLGYASTLKIDQPLFTGSIVNDIDETKSHRCIPPKICCLGCGSDHSGFALEEESNELLQECVEKFHRLAPIHGENADSIVISIGDTGNSMKVSKGVDLIEAILLCCAYSYFRGKSIGGS
ncbi:hypothetical protein ACHAWX_001673 [Stephanocyclus meneghinianus]